MGELFGYVGLAVAALGIYLMSPGLLVFFIGLAIVFVAVD